MDTINKNRTERARLNWGLMQLSLDPVNFRTKANVMRDALSDGALPIFIGSIVL